MDHFVVISTDCSISPSIQLEGIPSIEPSERAQPIESNLYKNQSYLHAFGIAWYPSDDTSATLFKELQKTPSSKFAFTLKDWEQFYSNQFICYTRRSSRKMVRSYIQPFSRAFGSQDWIGCILGTLPTHLREIMPLGDSPVFEPTGKSPAEYVFCWLLNQLRELNTRTIGDLPKDTLHKLLSEQESVAGCTVVLSDGKDIVVYRGANATRSVYFKRIIPPIPQSQFQFYNLNLDIGDDLHSTYIILSSAKPKGSGWLSMVEGQMLLIRQGLLLWDSEEKRFERSEQSRSEKTEEKTPDLIMVSSELSLSDSDMIITSAEENLLQVFHETLYQYEVPVEFSRHYIRLFPIHDRNQQVLSHEIKISTDPVVELFEDVFDNVTGFFQLKQTFQELQITMKAEILVRCPTESLLGSPSLGQRFPIIWMPWQRQIMMPYLLPMELPESQLSELNAYARSFVQRNDNDVLAALDDINETIYRDYTYDSGTTTIHTTPYDVYVNRHGVCQDFANLFICLVRLLSIPARYRVGYIYTGHDYERRIQSDASHAWVEVYLPWIGWKGYDPTNGCVVGTNHVRVACGRNYYDPPPTSGTIYKGGYGEKLDVSVRVHKLSLPP